MAELEQIKNDLETFRAECMELQSAFNTFKALYESGEETEATLRASAPLFFYDLNGWLIELIILKIGRLTDPASTGGKENLSVCWIREEVGNAGRLTPEIDTLVAEIMTYREKIKPARDKIISHADLRTFRENLQHGEHTKEETLKFFKDLNRFTDAVGNAIGAGPLDYSVQAGSGDVNDLIRALRKSSKGSRANDRQT